MQQAILHGSSSFFNGYYCCKVCDTDILTIDKTIEVMFKMSNGFIGDVLYLLLNFIEFILKIVFIVGSCIIYTIKLILYQIVDAKMIETSKKRKRNSNEKSNLTMAVRGVIDANWQLLSNALIKDKKIEKPQEDKKDHYTGTFRRTRKKKDKDDLLNAVHNVKTLNLAQEGNSSVKNENEKRNKLTKFLAMDCEMVGIGFNGDDHMLARVSIVNKFGDCVYDKFVKAREEVKDYRTSVSGVRKEDLLNGEEFSTVQKEVSDLIKGRILVGHSLKNDLSVLFLSHAKRNIRDTCRYKPFKKVSKKLIQFFIL